MTSTTSYPNPMLHWYDFGKGSVGPTFYYTFMRFLLQMTMPLLFKTRVFNRHFEPDGGSAVYICNHQSFLDPILMSFALKRPMNYMARDTLFHSPIFKWMIESVNAFPVKRGTADTGAMKEAIRRLKAGGQLVLFAEGTRTLDGRIGPLLPGVALLSQRSADWTVPVVIDGAFECWPRTQPLPSPGNIVVQYGRPIPQSEARSMEPHDLMARVRRTLVEIQTDLRRRIGRPCLKYEDLA